MKYQTNLADKDQLHVWYAIRLDGEEVLQSCLMLSLSGLTADMLTHQIQKQIEADWRDEEYLRWLYLDYAKELDFCVEIEIERTIPEGLRTDLADALRTMSTFRLAFSISEDTARDWYANSRG